MDRVAYAVAWSVGALVFYGLGLFLVHVVGGGMN